MEENSLIFLGGLFLFACLGIYIAYRYKKQAEENKRREEAIQRRLDEIKASNERMIQRTKAARSFGNTSSVKTPAPTPAKTQYRTTSDTRTMSSIEDDTDIATMMLMNNLMSSPSVSAVSASSSYSSSSDDDTSTRSSYTSSYSSSSSDSSYSSSSSDSSYSSSSDSSSSWD